MTFESRLYRGQAVTTLPNGTTTDSATAGTALATGYQHPANGVISMGPNNAIKTTILELAKAKGLASRQIMARHALPHAVLPLISLLGLSLPFLFVGAFLTEVIFAWPGMGRVMVEAIFSRDYPVVLAIAGLSAILVIAGNLLADLLYRFADPRIRVNGYPPRFSRFWCWRMTKTDCSSSTPQP